MDLELLPYFLLLLAVLAGWLLEARFSLLFLGLAVASAIGLGRLDPIAVIWIVGLGLSIGLPAKYHFRGVRLRLSYGAFLLLALPMASHLLPGFHNLVVFHEVRFSPDSIPFTMFLNFDQTVVGLFVLLFFIKPNQPREFGKKELLLSLQMLAALSVLIFAVVLAIRYVRLDIKFPPLGWIWVLNNLFFVCLAEEAFFRGFIQKILTKVLPKTYAFVAVLVASLLFGLAHYQGGPQLMGLAALAGLFFGYAYQRTNRIESAILVHFGLNLVHFVFFSYPALQLA